MRQCCLAVVLQPLLGFKADDADLKMASGMLTFSSNLILLRLCHAGWCVIAAVWAMFFMPETKGIPIDEVHLIFRKHWFWGRVTGTADAALPQYDASGVEINRASVTRVSLQRHSMNPDDCTSMNAKGLSQYSMDPKMLANKGVTGALTGDNHADKDYKVAETK